MCKSGCITIGKVKPNSGGGTPVTNTSELVNDGENGTDKFITLNDLPPIPGGGITELTGDVTASGSGSVMATIANGAVTNEKIANGAVTNEKIVNGAVTNEKINDNEVSNNKLSMMPGHTIKGNDLDNEADAKDLSRTEAQTMLNILPIAKYTVPINVAELNGLHSLPIVIDNSHLKIPPEHKVQWLPDLFRIYSDTPLTFDFVDNIDEEEIHLYSKMEHLGSYKIASVKMKHLLHSNHGFSMQNVFEKHPAYMLTGPFLIYADMDFKHLRGTDIFFDFYYMFDVN